MSNIATDNPTNFLTEQEVAEIESEISHLPNRPSAAIAALKIVQSSRG
ncbi:MAG: NADH-quinone oxidoreductase subunit NuoE, partial [Gammaproteobacteria bacterium]|nr:NADH-quinone oxidoreductase subunit NuoE [Gammaproteobacteria bacterium]